MNKLHLLFFAMLCLSIQACASKPIDRAFAGKMDRTEETKTIVEYCQSCHLHRKFKAPDHIATITAEYKSEPYGSAEDCRTCHSIKRDFWDKIIRNTHFPKGRLVNG